MFKWYSILKNIHASNDFIYLYETYIHIESIIYRIIDDPEIEKASTVDVEVTQVRANSNTIARLHLDQKLIRTLDINL